MFFFFFYCVLINSAGQGSTNIFLWCFCLIVLKKAGRICVFYYVLFNSTEEGLVNMCFSYGVLFKSTEEAWRICFFFSTVFSLIVLKKAW